MKKSLSLLVAIAMVFSMFATVAAAEELDTQGKFEALKEAGILEGRTGGDPAFDSEMTRAEFATVVFRVLNKVGNLEGTPATFDDVPSSHWASNEIGAIQKQGIIQGVGNNKFAPSKSVTKQELIKVVVTLLGLEVDPSATVSGKAAAWAQPYVAAAEKAGLIPAQDDYTVNALRGFLVDVTYQAYQEISKAGALKIAKVEQTNVGEITVSFNRAAEASEKSDLTFEVKSGLVTYNITAKWADDNKSVALQSNYLPAGEYDVTVKGFDPVKVTVVDEKAAKIEITANSLQQAKGQDPGVKLYNQFGKEMDLNNVTVTVFNATKGKTIAPNADNKYDLDDEEIAKVDDTFVVTATHSSGVSATKTFKLVAGSAATKITLGQVQPLEDKSRVSAGDKGLVLPYEMIDQYGTKITLPKTDHTTVAEDAKSFDIAGITFLLSETGVVGAYEVDEDGVLKLDFEKAATLTINAVNPATGATASTVVKIDGPAKIATFQMSHPGTIVVAGEEVKIPYVAVDNFGDSVAGKDIKLGAGEDELDLVSNVDFTARINGKGELIIVFDAGEVKNDTNAFIYAYVNKVQVGRLENLAVRKPAEKVKINGIKDVPRYFTVDAEAEFDEDNITFLDNYNRTKNVAADDYEVVKISSDAVVYDAAAKKLVAKKQGKAEITVNFKSGASDKTEYKFTVEVVKDDDVKSYEIKTIGTIYGKSNQTAASKHAKTVELVGKLSNGSEVAIVQDKAFDFVTSSDATKVGVEGKVIFGLDEGESTIAAYKGGTKLAEQVVKVSEAAPVAATVSFSKDEYELSVGGTLAFTINNDPNKLEIKDQYGVAIDAAGFLVTSDADVVTVDQTTKSITAVGKGTATITYITSNNVQGSTTVVVN